MCHFYLISQGGLRRRLNTNLRSILMFSVRSLGLTAVIPLSELSSSEVPHAEAHATARDEILSRARARPIAYTLRALRTEQ